MLNILTKYSTMVTNGSTGSTTHVPVMPRAKGFCITTHKQTQRRRRRPPKNLLYWHGDSHDGTSHTHHRSPPHFPIWPHTHKGEAFPHTDPRQDPHPHPHIRTTYITHTPQTTTHRTPPLCPQREREREAKLGVPCQTSCSASTRNGMPFY